MLDDDGDENGSEDDDESRLTSAKQTEKVRHFEVSVLKQKNTSTFLSNLLFEVTIKTRL